MGRSLTIAPSYFCHCFAYILNFGSQGRYFIMLIAPGLYGDSVSGLTSHNVLAVMFKKISPISTKSIYCCKYTFLLIHILMLHLI